MILAYIFYSRTLIFFQFVVKGLDLLDVAVSKCLSPNMALLLNDETDPQIKDLEDIILKYTRSQSWEIRCMALQIIGTVARMAKNSMYITPPYFSSSFY